MAAPRRRSPWPLCIALSLCWACVGPEQNFALHAAKAQPSVQGSVQVERIEGGQRLVVLELTQLPPPERLQSGLTSFVVWLHEEGASAPTMAGTLHYDRERQSGNLMATTPLSSFTIRVTAERQRRPSAPSQVLIAERSVEIN